MTIRKAAEGKMKLAHARSNGKTREITISVDAQSRSFITKNIDSISFDVTNDILRFREADGSRRPLANVLANDVYRKDVYKVVFEDGNRLNLTKKNLS